MLLKLEIGEIHERASIDHLHAKTKVLCAEYLASTRRPNHPSYQTVYRSTVPRLKEHTLQSIFRPSIDHLLIDGNSHPADLDQTMSTIHTKEIIKAIQN